MALKFWARKRVAQLRYMMRGHFWCKKHDGFVAMRKLHNGLIHVHMDVPANGPEWFLGSCATQSELVVRQFVYDRFGGARLNQILFAHIGSKAPISAGMPASWCGYLEKNGWSVNRWVSLLAWQYAIFLRFAHGILQTAKLCLKLASNRRAHDDTGPYAYFEGLSPANLPLPGVGKDSHDICTFYAEWPARDPQIRAICHDVIGASDTVAADLRVSYLRPPYELAAGLVNAVTLALWGIGATTFALLQLPLGRWHFALILGEAAKAKAVCLTDRQTVASEYLFHLSRNIYRPMWTYEVERMGSKVAVYFYSTYVQPKLASGYEPQNFEWGPNTWPRFLVWDHYQAERMGKELGSSVQLLQVGPIKFSDGGMPLPPMPPRSIAVFDIQPHRPSAHLGISTMADCMAAHPDFYHRFLSDVTDVLSESGAIAVLKTKREISARGDKRYGRILKRIENSADALLVDPALSAIRVAAHCRAGISAPFTSTAIHVQAIGIPSVYYDPVGWLQTDDNGAHGIPVITGKANLKKWVDEVLAAE